jgi:hypothetical protein
VLHPVGARAAGDGALQRAASPRRSWVASCDSACSIKRLLEGAVPHLRCQLQGCDAGAPKGRLSVWVALQTL